MILSSNRKLLKRNVVKGGIKSSLLGELKYIYMLSSKSNNLYGGILKISASAKSIFKEIG